MVFAPYRLRHNCFENLPHTYLPRIRPLRLNCCAGSRRNRRHSKDRQDCQRLGDTDLDRTARVVLDEYRGARIGRFTLEQPEENR